ncbi:integrase [Aromatoleum evansii]|uniref:integrase n=1 Tax=Aromatoleum evansii TaxID=59406 RepID=UPI00145FA8BE|nr:integrase [Aromatoleum evansii]NMG29331.1 integrase [Aromatoleum evansii]
MVIATDPTRDYLCELAGRLESAAHGRKGALLDEAQALYGWSRSKLYAELERQAGWTSGRKVRADKGRTSVAPETLSFVAALERGSVRQNGKQTLFTPVAGSIAAVNGHDLGVSAGHMNRLIRTRRLGVKQQSEARAPTTLRSLHPNHVHQVDPSLCLVYYLRGEQRIIRDDEFYKNKLEKLAKVQFKCWRYVIYDHASGLFMPWYVEAAGESPLNLYRFLMFAWGRQEGRRFHGVPKILMWDKGSANTATPVQNLLRALEVESITHAAGNARAKGGVENSNNLTETQFESRLRFDPVHSVAELNAAAAAWAEAYGANAIPGQDTRLRRDGMAPTARYDLWMRIREDELRLLPPEEVCQAFLEGRVETRKVARNLTISYAHPRAERPCTYDVAGLPGVCAGDRLEISPLLFGQCAISMRVPRFDGEDITYRLEPRADEFDTWGRPMSAPVIGEQYASRPESDADRSAKQLDALLFPGMTTEEMAKARRSNAALMGGAVDAVRHLSGIEIPVALPRRGTDIAIQASTFETPPLSTTEAAQALRGLGVERQDLYAWLSSRYPDGVKDADLPSIAARLKGENTGARLQAVGA